jgi:soluble lytic murein transglycosylase
MAADFGSPRDMHVWRAEYEHALSVPGGELDDAACLTMSGDMAGALKALGQSDDKYRRGLLAYKAGFYRESVDLLETVQSNPHLEFHRLYFRTSAYFRLEHYTEAAESAILLLDNPVCNTDHPLRSRALELLLETALCHVVETDTIFAIIESAEPISNRSSILLAKIMLKKEREEAASFFLRGISSAPDSLSEGLYRELIEYFSGWISDFELDDVFLMADAAISQDMLKEAHTILSEAEKNHPGDYRLKLAKGDIHRASGKRKRALRVYKDLFRSHASIGIKKEALLKIASIEYGLKRYELSAENYRLFGLYYPSDRRSARSLDLAARLFVSSGNYPDALQTWSRLRVRGSPTRISNEASLSEAVLRYKLGQGEISHSILKDLLAKSDMRHKAGLLYWLSRTSKTPSERNTWKKRLEDECGLSFYALVSREGIDALKFEEDHSEQSSVFVERLEQREREFVNLVYRDLEPRPPLLEDPTYEALDYLLGRGFIEEARACVTELADRFGSDSAAMAALYATVRSSGLVDLGLKLLWTKGLSSDPTACDISLRYPIAYSASVSEAAARNRLPVELILAVIREESSFDRYAVSWAGAMGLMQLMPRTGSWIGKKIDTEGFTKDELLIPANNIAAGSWYLRYLLNRSECSIVAALASYNGGETHLSRWRKTFKPVDEPVLAIELIGPMETRRYVKRVLDSMTAYTTLAREEGGKGL